MRLDDLSLQDEGQKPSRVDGMAERIIMSKYTREAHEKAVCAEVEKARSRRTIAEMLLVVAILVGIWVALRTWVAPEQTKNIEQAIVGLF